METQNQKKYPYIAIEGVIGAGKTTLARLLQSHFSGDMLLEAFDANPFLSDFYGDRSRYAFQTQIFFLLSRYRQQQAAPELQRQGPLIADYFFEKDKLFAHLNITGADELEMYDKLYAALSEKTPRPDLVVYLRAEVETLMARIAMRDRPYERAMDREYITALRRGYEMLFASYTTTPLLVIETDEVDFVRRPQDLDDIEHRIRAALSGVHQPSFPEIPLAAPTWAWDLIPAEPPESGESARRSQVNWEILGDFLALTESVGKIGGALAQQPPVGPEGASQSVQQALQNTALALTVLAQRLGARIDPLES
ncbi:MAG: deoxynucleoside kinase [Anaerolineae bacterium]|nr:deoxynucleoside kinase [Anaerolineae bacterium]